MLKYSTRAPAIRKAFTGSIAASLGVLLGRLLSIAFTVMSESILSTLGMVLGHSRKTVQDSTVVIESIAAPLRDL